MTQSNATPHDVRFAFGRNWAQFLSVVDDDRIGRARQSLAGMLGVTSLDGRTFLDIGSGSGLFSLAAYQLGAARVHSFDFDTDSVRCAEVLRDRFAQDDARWTIERGSVLDNAYMAALGSWDVVYSWGVLHHTGQMWDAIALAADRVAPGGTLFIAIYNDQGWKSTLWTLEKRLYVRQPWLRPLLIGGYLAAAVPAAAVLDVARGRAPWRRYTQPQLRGMSWYYDMLDWLGGYPFEVASVEAITSFLTARGFQTRRVVPTRSLGCSEFVFTRAGS